MGGWDVSVKEEIDYAGASTTDKGNGANLHCVQKIYFAQSQGWNEHRCVWCVRCKILLKNHSY